MSILIDTLLAHSGLAIVAAESLSDAAKQVVAAAKGLTGKEKVCN